MSLRERVTVRAFEMHDGVQCGEGNAHVGRVGRDAGGRGAEDGVDAVEAVDGVAALSGDALVTGGAVVVVEVCTAGALQKVSADGRHVADLRGGTGENGAGEDRILRADGGVLGEGGVAGRCADADAAFGRGIDRVRERCDVDEGRRPLKGFAHQVDQVGATAEVFGAIDDAELDGGGAVRGAGIGELVHCAFA